jgi:type I restriction enzyme S subunit
MAVVLEDKHTNTITWKASKVKELPIELIDGDRSSKYPKREEFVLEGFPFFNTTNIQDNRLNLSELNFVTPEKFSQITKGRLQKHDLVMTTRGSVGKIAYFDCVYPTGLINAQMLILRSKEFKSINPKFLFYVFTSEGVQTTLKNFASGSAQPQLPVKDLREIELTIPDIEIQQKIAAILSAYDDLIENNLRRIKLLEAMAQRLYREWFVHFRYPGHGQVPLVDSPLGPIPEGWEVKSASEAMDINPRTQVPRDGLNPFVTMDSLSTNSMVIGEVTKKEGNSGSKFKNGDTLFARITPCLENGKTGFVQFLPSDEQTACGSTEFIVLRSRTLTPEFVYLLARTDEFRSNAIQSMSGASGRQRVHSGCFDKYLLSNPDPATLEKFSQITSPMFKLIHSLSLKNRNLRQTRDLLLPRLISGQLDVSALEVASVEAG